MSVSEVFSTYEYALRTAYVLRCAAAGEFVRQQGQPERLGSVPLFTALLFAVHPVHVLRTPVLPAFRLGDLAEAMGKKYNVIGLPEHEKMHESMGPGKSSDSARRMTVDELREELKRVP